MIPRPLLLADSPVLPQASHPPGVRSSLALWDTFLTLSRFRPGPQLLSISQLSSSTDVGLVPTYVSSPGLLLPDLSYSPNHN